MKQGDKVSIRPHQLPGPPTSISQPLIPSHLIPLQLMPQQASASPGCDWTGVSDPKARKKIQDRIHQRIRRHRRKALTSVSSRSVEEGSHAPAFWTLTGSSIGQKQLITEISLSNPVCTAQQYQTLDLGSFTACESDSKHTEWFIHHFTANAHQDFVHGSPRVDMLLSLVQFNTTRALVMNARIMGITREFMAPESRSRLASEGIEFQAYKSLPSSLKPTHLQLTESHHPWIDILPFPEIRDNLVRYNDNSYDNKELCRDLRGFQTVADGYGGMFAWGDPWNSHGWEITEAFAAKWPWVVKDCYELLVSTNYWRATRGESNIMIVENEGIGKLR